MSDGESERQASIGEYTVAARVEAIQRRAQEALQDVDVDG